MIYLQFLVGLITYCLMCYISYSAVLKSSSWYYPIGLVSALITNYTWLWISKVESNPSKLLVKGLYWDAMITLVYLILPLYFFHAKLNTTQSVGLGLIVMGLTLIKL